MKRLQLYDFERRQFKRQVLVRFLANFEDVDLIQGTEHYWSGVWRLQDALGAGLALFSNDEILALQICHSGDRAKQLLAAIDAEIAALNPPAAPAPSAEILLAFVRQFEKANGRFPRMKEMREGVGHWGAGVVYGFLKELMDRGEIVQISRFTHRHSLVAPPLPQRVTIPELETITGQPAKHLVMRAIVESWPFRLRSKKPTVYYVDGLPEDICDAIAAWQLAKREELLR